MPTKTAAAKDGGLAAIREAAQLLAAEAERVERLAAELAAYPPADPLVLARALVSLDACRTALVTRAAGPLQEQLADLAEAKAQPRLFE